MQQLDQLCRADYADTGMVLANDARSIKFEIIKQRQPDTSILVFVREGYMDVELQHGKERIMEGQALFLRAGRSVRHPIFSEDFKGHAIIFDLRFGQQIITITGNIWRYLNQLDDRPVISIPAATMAVLNEYYRLLKLEVRRRNNMYYNEIVPSLLRNMLYTFINDIRQSPLFDVERIEDVSKDYDGSPQALALFHRFIDIMVSEQCTHRDISYYAERLCVSAKHLSAVCKRVSQRTARQWICNFMINGISNHLRYSDKSIKEISVIYGFPNMSVFSKFVKNNLGQSPSQIAKGHEHSNA